MMDAETCFAVLDKTLFGLFEDHTSEDLALIKLKLNMIFSDLKCIEVMYTHNTDKLFFGLKVYPVITGNQVMDLITDDHNEPITSYVVEFDSKLFDPTMALDAKELTALLLHEVSSIMGNKNAMDEVRNHINMYFAQAGDHVDSNPSKGYRELLAYGVKDALSKLGSIFSKMGNDGLEAAFDDNQFGYAGYLQSTVKKIAKSYVYMGKSVDDRFIILSWILRLRSEFSLQRIPAIKTIRKSIDFTGSRLEQNDLQYALNIISKSDLGFNEGALDNVKDRWSKKLSDFKAKGVRSIRNDVYELNLRLRQAEDMDDLMFIIRKINNDIAIIQDYMTEDISEAEQKECAAALEELYDLRQRAAKDKQVKDRYSSLISVTYI